MLLYEQVDVQLISTDKETMMKTRIKIWRLLVAAVLVFGLGTPAQAALQAVGPVSVANGFPVWYEDTNNLRLDLCLDQNGFCLLEEPNPAAPISFPDNFGPEAFWYSAETFATGSGINGQIRMDLEAAFANEEAAEGDQVAFARIRIRVDTPVAGIYTITHPFGVAVYDVPAGIRAINETQDIGDFANPGRNSNFAAALADGPNPPVAGARVNEDGRSIGPFLTRADGTFVTDPVTGFRYLGSPLQLVAVTGSPFGTNFFRIEGPGGIVAETNVFTLMGKISGCTDLNEAPTAVNDLAITKAETAVLINVLANDSDVVVDIDGNGDETTRAITPAVGTVTIVPGSIAPANNGTVAMNADNTITFTPAASSTGVTTFRYTVTDFCALVSNEATVAVFDERIVVATAEYRARTGKWLITGTSNQPVDTLAVPNVITLRAGSGAGPVIGSATVQGDGSWSFSGKSTASPGAVPQTVHATSALGISETLNLRLR